MKNKIAIREIKIDWLKIIKLALNREGWGTRHVLYECKDIMLTAEMDSFSFKDNKATIYIKAIYKEDEFYDKWESYTIVYYYLKNFTPKDFSLVLNKKILSLLHDIVKSRTLMKAKSIYTKAIKYDFHIDKEDFISAGLEEEYNTINAIKNLNIKASLIHKLKRECSYLLNKPYEDSIKIYCDTHKESVSGIREITQKLQELNKTTTS